MTEETHNAAVAGSVGIIMAIGVSAVLGLFLLLGQRLTEARHAQETSAERDTYLEQRAASVGDRVHDIVRPHDI